MYCNSDVLNFILQKNFGKYDMFMHNNVIQAQHITIFALLIFFAIFFVFGVTLTGCQCFPTTMSI